MELSSEDEKIPSYDEVMLKRQYIYLREHEIHNRRLHHITLKRLDANEEQAISWKFHISIDDSDSLNVKKMWNVVAPVLVKRGVMLTKFSNLNCSSDNDVAPFDQGRHITIYCALNPEFGLEEWKSILEEVCGCLSAAGIPPGYSNAVCRPVAGTNYVAYRNDFYEGEYKSTRWINNNGDIPEEMRYNPSQILDKFEVLVLDVNSELPSRKRAELDDAQNQDEAGRGCCRPM